MQKLTLLLLPLALVWSLPAAAAVIYDNGAPTMDVSFASDFSDDANIGMMFHAADDFVLHSPSVLMDVHWWGAYGYSESPETDSFTIRLYEDASGQPAAAPFYEVSGISGDRTFFAPGAPGAPGTYEYSADITPVVLEAGITYWISIINDTSDDTDDDWFWTRSGYGYSLQRVNEGDWLDWERNSNLAFQLTGAIIPEPASMALLGLGLTVMLLRRRAHRQ